MALSEKNDLLAMISFMNEHEHKLEPLTTYKLRMNAERMLDSHEASTFSYTNGPNQRPFQDLKLITYGFIYLQDLIEQSILVEHTGRKDTPGIILKQFPHPCYIDDWFLSSLAYMFPLFMVLSWVYSASMIVKNIVQEKEQKLKETTRVLGMGNGVHWCSWFIDSIIPMIITILILSLILVYGGVLANAEYSLVVVFLLCYAIATVSKCFLISTFFSKANLAAASGGIIFFTSYLPYPFIEKWYIYFTPAMKMIAVRIPFFIVNYSMHFIGFVQCLLSNVALGLGSNYFGMKELEGTGSKWNNVSSSPVIGDTFNLLVIMVVMLLDSVLYLLLTWYIENVFPGNYGMPKPWNFLFTKSYWFPLASTSNSFQETTSDYTLKTNDMFEEEPNGLTKGVSLKNLCKTYKSGKVALRNLSMNFYEDQITAFLGRNGAGKTTTISILTGLFPPTSGYASIYGLDVQTQMNLIRRSLGICPQYNVFFRDFTVQEHLWFFARLKGHTTGDVQVEIQQILTDLGLINKSESLAKRLSGGMKRKLSIAIAFIGGSRTVVLDEPTAGVDPYSRMSIWNLILKYKQGRTIILTTHNMTEAELLGDRIAICDSGELLCCGSSAFLKAKLGWGYMLTIDCHLQYKNPETLNAISKKVTESVLKIMPTAKEVEQFGTEIKYSLPNISGHVNMYQMLFDYLRDQKTQLDISSYGIADTSLEEIFLKLINKKEDHPQDKPFLFPQFDKAQNVIKDTFIERIKHVMCQFQALFAKRLIRSKRNKLGLCFELLLPALFVCFCMSITSEIPILKQPHAMDIDVTNCSRCTSFFNVLPQSGNWSAKYVKELSSYTGFGSKCIGNLSIKNHNSICMKPLYINGTRPKIKHNLEECSCEKGTFSCNFNSSQDLPDRLITSSGHVMLNATEEKNITEWILTTWSNYEPMRTGGFTFGLQLPMKGVSLSTTFKENGSVSELKNPNGTSITDNILIWFNNKWPISPVVYLNGVNNLILRASMPEKESHKYGIKLIMQGMNYTVKQYQSLILGKAATALLHSISLIFALSFVPASFVLYLIEERETNSKHLQFLAGVNWALYWIQVFVWDLCCYLMSSLLCILTLVAFKEEAYVSRNSIFCLMSLIFLHGWANIPLMYLSSHCFRVPSSAFVILSCLNISIGVITTATTYVLKVFNDEYFKTIENFLRNIFLLFPQFCLGDGVMKIAEVYFITKSLARYDVKIKVNLYAWENLGKNYALLITEGFIFFVLTLIFEKYRQQGFNACSEQIVSMDPPPHLDDDVESERKRILNTSVNDVLVMKCLSKVYKGSSNVAVNQLCLGVNKGECFGLLGLNGAGKSSTFKMLTGDTTITFGDATINGNSIRENINNVKKFIGYCPQYDALDAKLTPREHLTFYSHFRDIPSGEIETIVDSTLEIFDLCKYKDVCTKYLSGGNKRKLSTALAVFGNPQLIFLDEPTNGMDPKARRYLWQVIKQCVIGGKAVILTSHSMAECEALCSSLTIMVNGHFTCLGSIQHLKDKYGQGYNLVVRAPITQLQSVKDMVNEKIPRCLLKSEHYTQLKYHLDTDVTNLSEVLTNLENAKDEGLIYDYSLSQKSLVEIFLHFVSQSVPQKYVERKNSCRCLKSHVCK
ncbi:ATP-binding cassette sub-family A member 2-like [Cimex lectularius]|uniref:ABC transporter domain-containing protein n=1 Tax=Cimex lectularius TaxID=79782 RepID=A0A8I6S9U1_CIMLE|nr:ATP-binding cassette sub-family A member 2-like [Cimex lectularius]